jgi:hypothetical protein
MRVVETETETDAPSAAERERAQERAIVLLFDVRRPLCLHDADRSRLSVALALRTLVFSGGFCGGVEERTSTSGSTRDHGRHGRRLHSRGCAAVAASAVMVMRADDGVLRI